MNNHFRLLIFILVLFKFVQLPAQKAFDDTLTSSNGKIIIHVLGHASVFIEYDTLKIYVDPYSTAHNFTGMPKADLIFVTHAHADHFDISAIDKIKQPSTLMIYPQVCASMQTYKGLDTIMANGDSVNILGLPIKAVPAYNLVKTQHPKGVGNGYVVQFGNKRIYFSGDGENVPEMADLKDIDVAFLGMSQPYNMTPEMLVKSVLVINPKVVIPYHYDNNDPSPLITLMKGYPNIEVLTGQDSVVESISNNEIDTRLTVYPNPTKNFLSIPNLRNNSEVNILDINGKVAFSKIVKNNGLIDVDQLSKGLYLLNARSGNVTRVAKFLKQ